MGYPPSPPQFPTGDTSRKTTRTHRLEPGWHYHFLGIGGVGMSALAAILHQRGFRVSGSDSRDGEILRALTEAGIRVSVGHDPASLQAADAVVYTSAIGRMHPIWPEVVRLGLPRLHRAEMLGALAEERRTVAVTGTHGKTTSTAVLACALVGSGWDPTVVVGGQVPQLGRSNYRLGDGDWLVCEADESDGSFVNLAPEAVLLTNVEADHLDHHGSLENLVESFEAFLERISPEGVLVYCSDNPLANTVAQSCRGRAVSYGMGEEAEFHVRVVAVRHDTMELEFRRGDTRWRLQSRIAGRQNAVNLCGVFALASNMGVPEEPLLRALSEFQGVARRQQFVGELRGLRIYDDYAHHPTEVRATLEQFLETHGEPVTVVFQPHLYSRTAYFAEAFAEALRPATRVYVTEIYGAREPPIAGVSGRMIVERLTGHPGAFFLPDWEEVVTLARNGAIPGGVLLTLGAGDITGLGPMLLREVGRGGR